MRSEERLARFERYAEWPLAAAALTFLITFSIQVLSPRPPDQAHLLWLIGWFIWALFIADYAVRLWLAPQRLFWFTRHLLDLAIVALPLVRPLRLLRLLFLIGILQRAIGNALRGKILVYTVSGVAILIYTSSLAVFDEKRYLPGATITTFGRALWWSVSTVTTVGYGDVYPITNTGRIIAVLLMIGGISLVGVVTASIASWIIQRVAEEEEAEAKEFTEVHLEELRDEIRAVGRQLRVLSDRIGDQRSAGGAQVDRSVDDDPVDLP